MHDFGVNVRFLKSKSVIFELNGGLLKRQCMIFGLRGDSRIEKA